MVLTKDWLNYLIEESRNKVKQFEENKDYDRGNMELGKLHSLEIVYSKLTEPPVKKIIKTKKIDADKMFSSIVRFYVDKKGYTVEQANEIAKTMVDREQARLT